MESLHEKKVWFKRDCAKRRWLVQSKFPVAGYTVEAVLAEAEGIICNSVGRYSADISVASMFDEKEALRRVVKSITDKGFEVLEVPEVFSKEELLVLWESPKAP